MSRSLWDESYLELVRLLKDAECRIDRQKLLVHAIKARGQDPANAEELLSFFETVLGQLRHSLTGMEEARGYVSPSSPGDRKRPLN